MTLNGKRADFTKTDLLAAAQAADVKPRKTWEILASLQHALQAWPDFAAKAGVSEELGNKFKLPCYTDLNDPCCAGGIWTVRSGVK
ncbi:MAG: hypothetical protein QNL33_08830, partial [Akkermansiaceae bacterium]